MHEQKISLPLAEQLKESTGRHHLDVIVELAQPAAHDAPEESRASKIAARKEAFSKTAEPVESLIRSLGGEVTDRAWINGALRARIDQNTISALSAHNGVTRLDVPHPLKADVM
jgi:hypothetical protein